MRTTLDIADDVLQAAKEAAVRQHSTAGKVLSDWARQGLQPSISSTKLKIRNGLRMLPRRGEIVTLEHVQKIMDQEGI